MRFPYLCLAAMLTACAGEISGSSPAPSAALTVKPDMRATVQRLTSRDGEGLKVTGQPGGMRTIHVESGLGQVIVAKTNADGTVSAKCVESADDGFLDGVQK